MSNTKKSLLNENTIRRFMKLAEIDTLSDGFVDAISERYGKEEVTEEEELEEGNPYQRDEDEPMDLPPEAGLEEPEPGLEEPEPGLEEPAEEGGDAAALADAVSQLMTVISGMTGVDIDVDAGDEEPEADLGEPAELDMGAPEEEEAPLEEDEEIPGIELEEEIDQEAAVNEITRRVAARLQKESRQDKVADQLSERILQRIKGASRRK